MRDARVRSCRTCTKILNILWGQATCGMVGFPKQGSWISCEDMKAGLSCKEDHIYWRRQRCKMFTELSKLKKETIGIPGNRACRKDFSSLCEPRWCNQQLQMLDRAMQGLVLTLVDSGLLWWDLSGLGPYSSTLEIVMFSVPLYCF